MQKTAYIKFNPFLLHFQQKIVIKSLRCHTYLCLTEQKYLSDVIIPKIFLDRRSDASVSTASIILITIISQTHKLLITEYSFISLCRFPKVDLLHQPEYCNGTPELFIFRVTGPKRNARIVIGRNQSVYVHYFNSHTPPPAKKILILIAILILRLVNKNRPAYTEAVHIGNIRHLSS